MQPARLYLVGCDANARVPDKLRTSSTTRGHKRMSVGYSSTSKGYRLMALRLAGYEQAHERASLTIDVETVFLIGKLLQEVAGAALVQQQSRD